MKTTPRDQADLRVRRRDRAADWRNRLHGAMTQLDDLRASLTMSRRGGAAMDLTTIMALVECQHSMGNLARIMSEYGDLWAEVPVQKDDFDLATYLCLETQLFIDDSYDEMKAYLRDDSRRSS